MSAFFHYKTYMLLISLKQGLIEDIPFISDSLLYSNLVFSAIKCDIINKK